MRRVLPVSGTQHAGSVTLVRSIPYPRELACLASQIEPCFSEPEELEAGERYTVNIRGLDTGDGTLDEPMLGYIVAPDGSYVSGTSRITSRREFIDDTEAASPTTTPSDTLSPPTKTERTTRESGR